MHYKRTGPYRRRAIHCQANPVTTGLDTHTTTSRGKQVNGDWQSKTMSIQINYTLSEIADYFIACGLLLAANRVWQPKTMSIQSLFHTWFTVMRRDIPNLIFPFRAGFPYDLPKGLCFFSHLFHDTIRVRYVNDLVFIWLHIVTRAGSAQYLKKKKHLYVFK